jgi:hypothetical protein
VRPVRHFPKCLPPYFAPASMPVRLDRGDPAAGELLPACEGRPHNEGVTGPLTNEQLTLAVELLCAILVLWCLRAFFGAGLIWFWVIQSTAPPIIPQVPLSKPSKNGGCTGERPSRLRMWLHQSC